MEIETKLEYSYSLTVALNNIFFQKSTRFFPNETDSEITKVKNKQTTSVRPIVRKNENLMIITLIYDVRSKDMRRGPMFVRG